MRRKISTALFQAAMALTVNPASAHIGQTKGTAWDIVSGLTTEIGPRLAGTEAEAPRDWAKARLLLLALQM